MKKKNDYHQDALSFATLLKQAKLGSKLKIGKFLLSGKKGVSERIQYNQRGLDLLDNQHEYTFPIQDGDLQVSLQLYENVSSHYRLFCFTKLKRRQEIGNQQKIESRQGMTFSLNLTTKKEADNSIFLMQKIKFIEQYKGSLQLAQAHRQQKQIVFCDLLKKIGFYIEENNDLVLGMFDPIKKQLVDIAIDKFLNDFIVISILKGHFQGNKGYQLEILPNYNQLDYIFTGKNEEKTTLPLKFVANKSKRIIPLGLRYKVFKRDSSKCRECGRTVADEVKLHVDHIKPFSLGGLTEMNNLQTLCDECNLGKSNKFID